MSGWEQKIGIYRGQQFTASWNSPRIPSRCADTVAWLLTVEGFAGVPTGGAGLSVNFQIAAMHTRNQTEENRFQSTQSPLWTTLTTAANPYLLPDGDWGTVATYTLGDVQNDGSHSVVIPKVMRGGYWSRLAFTLALTGGTTPGVQVSLEAILRGA